MDETYQEVQEVLNTLLPAMQADGGGAELVEVDKTSGVVSVRFKGMCLACPSIQLTLKLGIEATLKSHFQWITKVIKVD